MGVRSPAMPAGLTDHAWTMREWSATPSAQCAQDTTRLTCWNFLMQPATSVEASALTVVRALGAIPAPPRR